MRAEWWLQNKSLDVVVSGLSLLKEMRLLAASHLVGEGAVGEGAVLHERVALIVLAKRGIGMGSRGRFLTRSRLLGVNGRGGGAGMVRGSGGGEKDAEERCVGEGGWDLQSGDVVVVEELAPASAQAGGGRGGGGGAMGQSRLMPSLENMENLTSVTFYVPMALLSAAEEDGGEESGGGGGGAGGHDLVLEVEVDLRWTLAEVKKTAISAARRRRLGGGGGMEEEENDGLWERVHLRRTSKGPQLKDELKCLADLGVEEGALFFLRAGAPRLESQKTLKVFLALSSAATARPLLQITVQETWTVAELKAALAGRLGKSKDKQVSAAASKGAWPQGVPPLNLLRLRQKKGAVGGSVLKDEQVLTKALPRLADDTPIVLQLLDEPQAAAPTTDFFLIQVRCWRSKFGQVLCIESLRSTYTRALNFSNGGGQG